MNTKNRSSSLWIPPDLLAAIDAHGDEIRSRPGGKFSRNAWIVGVLRHAVAVAASSIPTPPGLSARDAAEHRIAVTAHRARLAEVAAMEALEAEDSLDAARTAQAQNQ